MSHTLINCTCKKRLGFSLLPFTLIPQYLKGSIDQYSEINSPMACSRWLPWFSDLFRPYVACMKRGSWETFSGSVSSVQVGSQIHPNVSPTSGEERFKYPLPRENQIDQMPYPRASKDNQIQTPCPAFPTRRLYIDRCILVLLCIWAQFFMYKPLGGLYLEGRFNRGFFALLV